MGGFSNESFDSGAFDPDAFEQQSPTNNTSFDGNAFSNAAFSQQGFAATDSPVQPPIGDPVDGFPFCVATQGYLTGINTLAVATDGYICATIIVFKDTGSGASRAVEYNTKLTAAQIEQLKREDEEIVAIISIIGEHLL